MEIGMIKSSELAALSRAFQNPSASENEARYPKQAAGDAAYVVARRKGDIVGKVYLKYAGATDAAVTSVVRDCPDMENLEVIEGERGKGVGTEIVGFAERLCRDKGFRRIGLGVAPEN